MIIDTSNAPCGPGFLPGPRLSEGRFAINRRPPRLRGWGSRRLRAFVPLRADRSGTPRLAPPRAGRGGSRLPLPLPGAADPSADPPQRERGGAAAGGRPRLSALTASLPPRAPQRGAVPSARVSGPHPPGDGEAGPPRPLLLSEPVSYRLSWGPYHGAPVPAFSAGTGPSRLRPQIRRDDPLNLSILLSGGKETNKDSLSSGERRGKSPAPNPRPTGGRGKCGVRKTACPVPIGGLSPSDRGSARGRCEAGNGPRRAGVRSSRSRVVWECSPKRVVNSI